MKPQSLNPLNARYSVLYVTSCGNSRVANHHHYLSEAVEDARRQSQHRFDDVYVRHNSDGRRVTTYRHGSRII